MDGTLVCGFAQEGEPAVRDDIDDKIGEGGHEEQRQHALPQFRFGSCPGVFEQKHNRYARDQGLYDHRR